MVILNKAKENELLNYGFTKEKRNDESYYYSYSKSFYIEGFNSKKFNNGKIVLANFSMINADLIYELIKHDILKKVDTPESVTNLKEISKILEEEV